MITTTNDHRSAIEQVRIEADKLTLACSAICGPVPIALGAAFSASLSGPLPTAIQRELDRTKGVRQ
ncbi:hypothetical protein IP68_02140 [Blastomonas sp. AAP25]|uniref:hypothetical protein n=1 Tax=Blastomonas sp. AAP25 TaxID=1523416 RepID=UPI0006B9C782|nr:hypothetical protein [Blastomonas sp. AAP25]KPF76718.1 hypothetical protein IP68_02140 [Blastomonas sp. AAP25]